MQNHLPSLGAVLLGAAVLGLGARATAQLPGPCWDTQLGVNLGLTDDSLAVGQTLQFPFPMPGGGSTTAIDISSNGFVYLVSGVSTDSGCCNGDPNLLVSGPQRIAAIWQDLNPSSGGGVYFSSLPGRAVITWDQVPEYYNNGVCTVQLQLYPDGSFSIAVREINRPGFHDMLIGVSQGNGAVDPGETDLTTALPFVSGGPTVYEWFQNGIDPIDVVGRTYYFLPAGPGYLTLEVTTCRLAGFDTFGAGCPKPPVVYEAFPAGAVDLSNVSYDFMPNGQGGWIVVPCPGSCFDSTFTNNLGLTDDSLAIGMPLGFSFPMPGSTSGSTNAIDVSSNGFVWLVSGSSTSSGCCSGDPALMLSDPERIAAIWTDLNPSSGGAVYFDARPGKAMITWDQVPEFGGSATNTVQLTLYPSGQFTLSYRSVGTSSHDALVGYSPGNGVDDPGSTDLTASVPFSTGSGGTPVEHVLGGSQLPQVGATIALDLEHLPTTTAVAFMNLGFVRLNIDLSVIGMQGCYLYSSGDGIVPMQLAGGGRATLALRIPNNPSLIGVSVYSQGLAVAPGSSGIGVIASNGGVIGIGM